ncbi:hypothetical protein FCN77_02375 [Arthrobacter sp. 24S4-2]|uniref:hypothetical protein n=1 Tax=Arthrobacter sp. 24S4-2 TaxID=2575374 RepID=UPI0010C7910C|nr:hypothetical protein [Arthrobacter sp. 24S4-2]QCO96775.1 hypothetical protein FCN77_02375 [Arthrobacter sp. 24S4-2]
MIVKSHFLKGRKAPAKNRPAARRRLYDEPVTPTGQARLWRVFQPGDRIEVIHNGTYSRTGIVHERTPDGKTLWILLDSGMGRIFVTEGDPVALVPYG